MKSMKKSLLGAAVAAALGFAASAQAGVVIDLFVDPVGPSQAVATSTLGATVTNQNGVAFPTTNVIGGYRDLSITKTDDTIGGVNDGESRLAAGGGVLSVDNATGNKSVAVVTWDGSSVAGNGGSGVNTTGLGGIDITAGGAANSFLASILAADLGFDYKITVWDMDGSKSVLEAGIQFGVSSTVEAGYSFSWFNLASGTYCDGVAAPPACTNPLTQLDFKITRTGGLIDFTQIGAMQLELSNASTISVDLALGSIRTVPEPGALALVGIALMGAGLATRRRSATKA